MVEYIDPEFYLRSIYEYLLYAWYAGFESYLRNMYALFTQHLHSIYAKIFMHSTQHLRSIYAAFTPLLRSIYAKHSTHGTHASLVYAVFTLLLGSIYAYLLYAWYAIFKCHLRIIDPAFTQYLLCTVLRIVRIVYALSTQFTWAA